MGAAGTLRSLGGLGSEEMDLARLEGLAKEMVSGNKEETSWL